MTLSPDDLARQLEPLRDYLGLLARLHLDQRLQGKVDLSGVVQQTLLEACQVLATLSVTNEEHRLALLRRVLANNLADEVRQATRAKRDAGREQSLQAALDQSSARLEAFLADRQTSPSERLVRQEQLLRMTRALAALPDNQRKVVELHHLQGRPLAEVAEEMGCTKPAVAGLLHRGLQNLRDLLATLDN